MKPRVSFKIKAIGTVWGLPRAQVLRFGSVDADNEKQKKPRDFTKNEHCLRFAEGYMRRHNGFSSTRDFEVIMTTLSKTKVSVEGEKVQELKKNDVVLRPWKHSDSPSKFDQLSRIKP